MAESCQQTDQNIAHLNAIAHLGGQSIAGWHDFGRNYGFLTFQDHGRLVVKDEVANEGSAGVNIKQVGEWQNCGLKNKYIKSRTTLAPGRTFMKYFL